MPNTIEKNQTVRFLNNFAITVTQTVLDKDDNMVVQENQYHIGMGDTYSITRYDEHKDGRIDIHFPSSSPLAGVAHNVEGDYCELRKPQKPRAAKSGCGGCSKQR